MIRGATQIGSDIDTRPPPVLHFTFKHSGGQTALHLCQGVDGPKAVDEAHHCQRGPGQRRGEHVLVETQPVATLGLQVCRQEGEAVVVPGGEHHHVHLKGHKYKQLNVREFSL